MKYSCDEIVEHIASTHARDDIYDEESSDLASRVYQFSYFILEHLPIDALNDNWNTDDDIINKYAEYESLPPAIVVMNDRETIIDGTHRVKSLKKKGIKTILAYVGIIDSN